YRPAFQQHSDRYGLPVGCVVLLLPTGRGLPAVGDAFVAQGAQLAGLAQALQAEICADDAAAALVRAGLALLASPLGLPPRPLAERGVPRWLRGVADRLADASAAAPTLSELARLAGREPAHGAPT